MKNRMKLLLLFCAGILIVLLTTACGMVVGQLDEGYNLVITVGGSGHSRLVEVNNYNVTKLHLLVTRPDPDGEGPEEPEFVDEFDWIPTNGMMRYVVNLGETGDYVLTVTHFCLVDGVETTAVETAQFEIRRMKITMISVTPGAIGAIDIESSPDDPPVDPPADLEGFWFGSAVPFWGGPGMEQIDVYIRIGPNDRYGTKLYSVGENAIEFLQAYSSFGTYETLAGSFASVPDALYYQDWSTGDPPEWMVVTGPVEGWNTPPFTLDGDTLTLHQEIEGEFYDWMLTRETEIVDPTGAWTGDYQIIPDDTMNYPDVEFSLLPNGEYEILMHHGDPTIVEDMSSRGYWWIADGEIVLDVMNIHIGGWVTPDIIGFPGLAWICPYSIDGSGALHCFIDFENNGTLIGEWILDPAP